jgi:hypothetical protein
MRFLSRWNKSSDPVNAYPRSRTEPWFEKYAKQARDSIRKSLALDVQMWMTDDSFEQVVTHYRAMGIERSAEFAKSLAKLQSEKSGREVKATYVIFDGAESAILSNHYVSVYHPVIVQYDPLEVHDVTAVGLYRMKR